MKQLLSRTALVVMLGISATPLFAKSNSPVSVDKLQPDRDQVIASLNIVELLKRHHYSKPPLNDAQSIKIYDSYLKMLDPARLYFTAADIREFDASRTRFDDYLKQGNLEPGFAIYRRYAQRVAERLNYGLGLLDAGIGKLDFKVDESFNTNREKAPWAADTAALDDLWRRKLKDEVLRLRLSGKTDAQIQQQLTKRYKNQLARLNQIRSEDVFQTYINAFAESYDPHTQYLSPESAENFDINMSLSLEGIGAVLQNDNDYVQILRLVPAGPADKSKQVAPGDKIVGVAQGDGEMVDVVGWRLDEVVKLIRGPKGSKVRLEIIPANNAPNDQKTKIVTITREAVKLEEQAAQKHVIDVLHEGKHYKLGVITVPAFYLDFKAYRAGDPNYKSTTRDVKKLIGELQKDKVDGIVMDLRNNGGGSLQEATELTGLFIDQGPTVLVRNGDGKVEVLADDEGGAFYKGPLAVLVNRLSASASEIFAGAMQDYHRALIVGGQTFGKGTVQTIQPLNHGELKLTIAKFYRVSGQSTQHQGVLPDIDYPAVVDTKQIGESALPDSMPWDTIAPAVTGLSNPFANYLPELIKRHDARAQKDPDFIFARERLKLAEELAADTTVSLDEQKRRAEQTTLDNRQLAMENERRKAKGEAPLKELKKIDEDNPAIDDDKTKPQDDAYLMESGHVLLDYLDLSHTPPKR
ncbi:peptidase S41 [Pseudomonas oryzihabitans]|uniref:carboxy terminal-processing peptidase n=1 Tax=Pseudomonas rhizoryzae TaxID=2571129 RepID=UPI00073761A4|nr:carboxy terminal-processing peptidase [Pseudomonas rhizoryzae]APQ09993.1 tail-specific protease [Pseudomonas psychrotolerans]KTS79101.1 peptidase S41 [Pseudomonas psychrotolerans]KTS97558.1 peptidase S41 [Pseudomonas psychrotolerans]KTT08392.1 peptidase S41 [Pseudomonas psychrotolerans]KTT20891.1 peptidase S41 [Pseudomonas psychrotolerans]